MAQPTKESVIKRELSNALYKQRIVRNKKKYSRKVKQRDTV